MNLPLPSLSAAIAPQLLIPTLGRAKCISPAVLWPGLGMLLAALCAPLAAAELTYSAVANEGQSFHVAPSQTVRYGVDGKWIEKAVSGNAQCTNSFFGGDPAYGTVKRCEQAGAVAQPGNSRVAAEGQSFALPSPQTVRYGVGGHWIEKVVSGTGQCTNGFFGGDPAYGTVKHCEQASGTVPPVVGSPGGTTGGPYVDATKIPTGFAGHAVEKVVSAFDAPRADTSGSFRAVCLFSHMSFDDPIVNPGQKGASHLHAFFGNTGANAASTPESMRTTGNSTCWGGTINRSSYWQPALIDTKDGRPIKPRAAVIYYKSGLYVTPSLVQPLPAGLRMVAGDAKASAPVIWGPTDFYCSSGARGSDHNFPDPKGPHSVPDCPVGEEISAAVRFPQCWDGRNLDSPDHKSHMAYFVYATGSCPATHPVLLPEITITASYPVLANDVPSRWRLSSDMYNDKVPGGYSLHADWFNGWKAEFSSTWLKNCVQASRDCFAHLLGNGQMVLE